MNKLKFKIIDEGMLEARELDRVYLIIIQTGDKYQAIVNGECLKSGDLYDCLDACNQHAYDSLYRKKLVVEDELSGCSYTKVNDIVFIDHAGKHARVAPYRFRSLEDVRAFIEKKSADAVVYVYDLREIHLDEVWYYLNCSIRAPQLG